MATGAEAEFEWSVTGSALNFDTLGDGPGNSISYEQGRGVATDSRVLRAAFDGNHGWFWRNHTSGNVTLTLRTRALSGTEYPEQSCERRRSPILRRKWRRAF